MDVKENGRVYSYSQQLGCIDCGVSYDTLEPRDFSFNSPFGACDSCSGLGVSYEVDELLLVKDQSLTIEQNVLPDMSNRR